MNLELLTKSERAAGYSPPSIDVSCVSVLEYNTSGRASFQSINGTAQAQAPPSHVANTAAAVAADCPSMSRPANELVVTPAARQRRASGRNGLVQRRAGGVLSSCRECYRLKCKCDGKRPCLTCKQRGRESLCADRPIDGSDIKPRAKRGEVFDDPMERRRLKRARSAVPAAENSAHGDGDGGGDVFPDDSHKLSASPAAVVVSSPSDSHSLATEPNSSSPFASLALMNPLSPNANAVADSLEQVRPAELVAETVHSFPSLGSPALESLPLPLSPLPPLPLDSAASVAAAEEVLAPAPAPVRGSVSFEFVSDSPFGVDAAKLLPALPSLCLHSLAPSPASADESKAEAKFPEPSQSQQQQQQHELFGKALANQSRRSQCRRCFVISFELFCGLVLQRLRLGR